MPPGAAARSLCFALQALPINPLLAPPPAARTRCRLYELAHDDCLGCQVGHRERRCPARATRAARPHSTALPAMSAQPGLCARLHLTACGPRRPTTPLRSCRCWSSWHSSTRARAKTRGGPSAAAGGDRRCHACSGAGPYVQYIAARLGSQGLHRAASPCCVHALSIGDSVSRASVAGQQWSAHSGAVTEQVRKGRVAKLMLSHAACHDTGCAASAASCALPSAAAGSAAAARRSCRSAAPTSDCQGPAGSSSCTTRHTLFSGPFMVVGASGRCAVPRHVSTPHAVPCLPFCARGFGGGAGE